MDSAQILKDLILPLCVCPQEVEVEASENGHETVLTVRANSKDVSHLIGRKGSMAQSLRSMMNIASVLGDVKYSIKFEANNQ